MQDHGAQRATDQKRGDQQQPAYKARGQQRTCRLGRSQCACKQTEGSREERIAARLAVELADPVAPQHRVRLFRRALVQKARALAHVALRKQHLEQPHLCRAALIAHVHAAAQRDAAVFPAEDRQIPEARPVADQHVELDRPAADQKRHIARQRRVRREPPRRGADGCAAQRDEPVAERQRQQRHDDGHADPAEGERSVCARKIALVERQRHVQRLMVLEPGGDRTADERFGYVQIDIVRDHVAVIPADEGGVALKRLRHGHGELIPADGVGPFRAQQRQLQRLHAVGLADEAGDCVQNRERPRAGKARRVAQHEHRAVAVGLLLRVVAGDGGLLRARDEREAQLRLRAVDLHGEGLRDLARAAAGQRAVGFHIGNGGLRRDHRRTERQKAGQQKQQPFHVITSAQGNPAHPAAGEIPVSFF